MRRSGDTDWKSASPGSGLQEHQSAAGGDWRSSSRSAKRPMESMGAKSQPRPEACSWASKAACGLVASVTDRSMRHERRSSTPTPSACKIMATSCSSPRPRCSRTRRPWTGRCTSATAGGSSSRVHRQRARNQLDVAVPVAAVSAAARAKSRPNAACRAVQGRPSTAGGRRRLGASVGPPGNQSRRWPSPASAATASRRPLPKRADRSEAGLADMEWIRTHCEASQTMQASLLSDSATPLSALESREVTLWAWPFKC
mmetsp:Transcript_84173/g.262914  ORF Transcript_84173/g.262914 Transcript_84173/m.262914 type:complete len:257 (-) Transcript_84173:280-1050(-)